MTCNDDEGVGDVFGSENGLKDPQTVLKTHEEWTSSVPKINFSRLSDHFQPTFNVPSFHCLAQGMGDPETGPLEAVDCSRTFCSTPTETTPSTPTRRRAPEYLHAREYLHDRGGPKSASQSRQTCSSTRRSPILECYPLFGVPRGRWHFGSLMPGRGLLSWGNRAT
jgi:hypothetical protein